MLASLAERLWALVRRRDFEDDLDEELRFHLEMETEKNIALGMSPDEAKLRARKCFGGIARAKEDVRSSHGLLWIDSLGQDIRDARRSLVKNVAGSLIIVGTLALGIGANTAIFSAIYGVLLRPLPYSDGDRLVLLTHNARTPGGAEVDGIRFSVKEVEDYRRESNTLASLVEYHTMPFILLSEKQPERVQTGVVSAEFFDVLKVEPLIGRTFLPGEDALDAEPVLVLSYEYWQRSHGGAEVVGTMLEMNDRPHRVVGILPPLPGFPDDNDVYMPVSACPFHSAPSFMADRGARMMRLIGRMEPGVTLAETGRELDAIATHMSEAHRAEYADSRDHAIEVTLLRDELTKSARPTFLLLLATAGFVLLVACANVANVTVARLLRRRRELELRQALGASRTRVARQLLTESTLLAVGGGVLGLLLSWLSLDLIIDFAARFTPRAHEIALDRFVLLFTLTLSVLTGLVFGTLPALFSPDTIRGPRLRRALVTAEVAASLVLLVGAGLMAKSLLRLHRVDPGFDSERVLTMMLDLNWSKYGEPEAVRDFHDRLLQQVSGHPGVLSAAVGRTFPLARGEVPQEARFEMEGASGSHVLDLHPVSREYFRTIGVARVDGRLLGEEDRPGSPNVVIVNRAAAALFWPNESPVGRKLFAGKDAATIVGVVENVRQYRLDAPATPTAYISVEQYPLRVTHLLVRTSSEPSRLADELVETVHAIDRDQAVAHVQTLEDVRSESLAAPRLTTSLVSMFATLALLITVAGLSGVLALSVSERESELGIRMALGATPSRVLGLVLGEAVGLIGAGLAIGAVAVGLLQSSLSRHLFEVEPTDPVTLGAVSLVLVAATALGCWLPARRATNIDPLDAVRAD